MAPMSTRKEPTGRRTATRPRPSTDIVALHVSDPEPAPEDPRLSDVDEWGRSEHMRALVRQLYEPVYSKWFRAEWSGLERIPTEGGALLVANHAGAIPSDAPVIMHGIERELGRPVYGLADYFFRQVPVLGTMWSRVWRGARQPRQRLPPAPRPKPAGAGLPRGHEGAVQVVHRPLPAAALRAGRVHRDRDARPGVPVVPIAVVGSEEAMPVVFRLPSLAARCGSRTSRSPLTSS